jgi:Acetyltransferase (GNAT) domain
MSLTASVPSPVTAALPRRGAAPPAESRAPHALTPFHSPQWGRAWADVRTEKVSAYRLLQFPTAGRNHHLPLYLVDSSPLWRAMEGDAGLGSPHTGASAVLRGPVTFARSLYAEYGGLPGAPGAVLAEAVDRGRDVAAEWESTALIVTNLQPEDVTQWSAARAPDAAVTLYWAHRLPLPGGSADEFVDATATARQHKARRELRRQWKRGTEAGLTLSVRHGRDILPLAAVLAAQAAATSRLHGPALYGQDMLAAAAAAPGAVTLVAMRGDEVAGAFVCFLLHGTFYLWTAALDVERRAELHTYAWLTWESIRYAIRHGAATLDAGRGNYAYKHAVGFHTVPLTSLLYFTADADVGLVNRLSVMHHGLRAHAERAWQSRPGTEAR